jgi:hypothetical protein
VTALPGRENEAMGKRVFVAVTGRQYEGFDTVGVASSRERAVPLFHGCVEDGRMECSHDDHRIEVWEVDGSIVEVLDVWRDEIEEAVAPRPSSPSSDTEAGPCSHRYDVLARDPEDRCLICGAAPSSDTEGR